MGLRVDGKPFTLEGREYIMQVIRDTSPEIVIPKAAQTAFTVSFLTRTLHWITQRKWHHLYLLPLKTGAIPFVQQRIDPIIDSNEFLRSAFKAVDNRLHKQSQDSIALYIRGTNIERELQEVPVDVEVWDERDRMVEENLEEARRRMDGSNVKKLTMLSTPTVPGHGVDADDAWWASDQHRWEVPCQGCGRFQVLNFEEKALDYNNLKLGDRPDECVIECAFCKREISDEERFSLNKLGRWVPHNLEGEIRGYHVSQFNSPTQPLVQIVRGYFSGQKDARKLKTFYNASLGIPYVAAGDQITVELLDKCRRRGYSMGGIPSSPLSIGIDVGTFIHTWIWHSDRYRRKMLWQLKIFKEWGELDAFLDQLPTFIAVCDANPEKRAARDLSVKYNGRFWMGFEEDRPATDETATWGKVKFGEPSKVNIERTMAFDTVINDMMNGNVILPPEARELGEHMPRRDYNGVYHQMIQQARVEMENARSQIVARWKKNRNPDHWHHACMFATVASMRRPTLEITPELQSIVSRMGSLVGS